MPAFTGLFRAIPCAAFLAAAGGSYANVTLPPTLSDHMVLQRGMAAPVWGTADAGEAVTVACNGQTRSATAGPDGKWRVHLDPMPAGGPHVLTVKGKNTLSIGDVMVGEVWIGSGQSNMDRTLGGDPAHLTADLPKMRFLRMGWNAAAGRAEGKWEVVTPASSQGMSAVSFFFAREIHRTQLMPVGMMIGAQGSTLIQRWLDPTIVPADPDFNKGGDLYWQYIAPMVPHGIRGALWYQGEGDGDRFLYTAQVYGQRLSALVQAWRKSWGQGDFPFYVVQLPNYKTIQVDPVQSDSLDRWALVREGQRQVLALPNTALSVGIDLGEAGNVHPGNKDEVGRRLSLPARALIHGEKGLAHSGPMYRSMSVAGSRMTLLFDHAGGGLTAKGSSASPGGVALKGFTVAGADGRWHWADAAIQGQAVVVSSAQVANPTRVRYAWADNPVFNLYNTEGLPASPFFTGTDLRYPAGVAFPSLVPPVQGRPSPPNTAHLEVTGSHCKRAGTGDWVRQDPGGKPDPPSHLWAGPLGAALAGRLCSGSGTDGWRLAAPKANLARNIPAFGPPVLRSFLVFRKRGGGMDIAELERRKFPIGKNQRWTEFRAADVEKGIADLEAFPALLRNKVEGISEADLERRYRLGGWTVRQVIHHVADSHVNSYTRFKLALTEERPVIKPYFEERWAELEDGRTGEIGVSLSLLDGIHARLVVLLRSMDEAAFRRTFFHPETGREVHLFQNVGIYAWHGRHHLAHIGLALSG